MFCSILRAYVVFAPHFPCPEGAEKWRILFFAMRLHRKKTSIPLGTEAAFRGTTRSSPNSALYTHNGVTRRTLLNLQAAAPKRKPFRPQQTDRSTPPSLNLCFARPDNLFIAFLISSCILSQFFPTFNRFIPKYLHFFKNIPALSREKSPPQCSGGALLMLWDGIYGRRS